MSIHRWPVGLVALIAIGVGPLAGQDGPAPDDKPKPGINGDKKPMPDDKDDKDKEKKKEKKIRMGFIRIGTARAMVDELLGVPVVGNDIPQLNRVKNFYRDGTEVNFFDNQAITVLPGHKAEQTEDGRFMIEREGYRIFIDANLLPSCGHPPLTPDLKCRIESEFNYSLPPAAPSGAPPKWRPHFTCCDVLRVQPKTNKCWWPPNWFHWCKNCCPQGQPGVDPARAPYAPVDGLYHGGHIGPGHDGPGPGCANGSCGHQHGGMFQHGPVLAPGLGTHPLPGPEIQVPMPESPEGTGLPLPPAP